MPQPDTAPSAPESPGPGARARNAGAVSELRTLQEHDRDGLDTLPDALLDTPCAERLQIIADADIEALEEIEPPRGYGRDVWSRQLH